MIIEPRTGLGSAMSASRTTAWYQLGKFGRFPSVRSTLKALCINNSKGMGRRAMAAVRRCRKLLCRARSRKN
jgi:hypothetical protein